MGVFLQSVGFPFDIQGPGSSRNVLLHFLHTRFALRRFIRTCGKNDVLGSNVKHFAGVLDG